MVSPAATSDGRGRVVVAWSEWKANQRTLAFRAIDRNVLGPPQAAAIRMPANGYQNAWWPSLTLDAEGRLWGAWNQHYPAVIGVCAGNLVDPAVSVAMDDSDKGLGLAGTTNVVS